jgi:hypothetical protein
MRISEINQALPMSHLSGCTRVLFVAILPGRNLKTAGLRKANWLAPERGRRDDARPLAVDPISSLLMSGSPLPSETTESGVS